MQQTTSIPGQRFFRIGATLLLAALASIALFGTIAAQDGGGATVRSEPPVVNLTQGQTTTVSFVVENIAGLYGADVRAAFEAAALEVVDADPAMPDIQIAPGSFLKPDFVVRSVADNAAGTLWYASTQVSPTLPVSGTGVLFTVAFRAKTDVTDAPITITYAKLVDRNGTERPVTVAGGAAVTATVSAPAAPATVAPVAATAIPTTAVTATETAATSANAATPAPSVAPSTQSPLCAPPGFILIPVGVVAAGVAVWAGRRKARQE